MLEEFTIRDIATYNEDGITIHDLKKINFIYGANGSGKTTISTYLYQPSPHTSCEMKWTGDQSLQTLVYNKEFRLRNFGNGSIPGVFTLGQATKEELEEIEKKKKQLDNLEHLGKKKKETQDGLMEKKDQYVEEFRDFAWNKVYKRHKDQFKEAFRGCMNNKSTFMERVIKEDTENKSQIKSFDQLKEKATSIFDNTPSQLHKINHFESSQITTLETDGIWESKILGKPDVPIADLINHLGINDWVNQGKNILQADNDTCPFCQQKTITKAFREQLENYFDINFENNVQKVLIFQEQYLEQTNEVLDKMQKILESEKAIKISRLNSKKFAVVLEILKGKLSENKELITAKIKEPSRKVQLKDTNTYFAQLTDLISTANISIARHNDLVRDYDKEKGVLVSEIWKYLIEEEKVEIHSFRTKLNGISNGIEKIEKDLFSHRLKYQNLNKEIEDLTKNITGIQPSVDEINKTLATFGFTNFKIEPENPDSNFYKLVRENGTSAESTLSEGEITFITFLYFIQLAKGSTSKKGVTKNRILVIDDPISSLDSNVLYIVSTLIKKIIGEVKKGTGNVKQVLLLTHNVYFHKEVSFIDGRTHSCKNTNFWILRKINGHSTIASYGLTNPIQNSYELLWSELRHMSQYSGATTVQNTMRRIIENYYKILGGYKDDNLIDAFEDPLEKEICRSLISWINDGSHTIPDDLFVEMPASTIEIYFRVFKGIFEKTGHHAHYQMMMKEEPSFLKEHKNAIVPSENIVEMQAGSAPTISTN